MRHQRPSVDFQKITFPSDALTIGAIRAAQGRAERFSFAEYDRSSEDAQRQGIDGLYDMFMRERQFARVAFEKAVAGRDPHSFDVSDAWTRKDQDVAAYQLNEDYRNYGLSRGDNETRHLIRNIERAAAAQAASVSDPKAVHAENAVIRKNQRRTRQPGD